MNYYRAVRQLNPADAAYIAGLVDGEGTVTLTTMHRGEDRRLVVSISNTECVLLEFVQAALGAGQITGKRTYNVKHPPSFAFRVTSRQAVELLRQVAPLSAILQGHARRAGSRALRRAYTEEWQVSR